jgi:hypothetical protein
MSMWVMWTRCMSFAFLVLATTRLPFTLGFLPAAALCWEVAEYLSDLAKEKRWDDEASQEKAGEKK